MPPAILSEAKDDERKTLRHPERSEGLFLTLLRENKKQPDSHISLIQKSRTNYPNFVVNQTHYSRNANFQTSIHAKNTGWLNSARIKICFLTNVISKIDSRILI